MRIAEGVCWVHEARWTPSMSPDVVTPLGRCCGVSGDPMLSQRKHERKWRKSNGGHGNSQNWRLRWY